MQVASNLPHIGNPLPKKWVETELTNIISHVIGGDWGKDVDYSDDDFIEVEEIEAEK